MFAAPVRVQRDLPQVLQYLVGGGKNDTLWGDAAANTLRGEIGDDIDETTLDLMERLLVEEDHDLWELVSGRRPSDDPAQQRLLARLQATPNLNTFATERH